MVQYGRSRGDNVERHIQFNSSDNDGATPSTRPFPYYDGARKVVNGNTRLTPGQKDFLHKVISDDEFERSLRQARGVEPECEEDL